MLNAGWQDRTRPHSSCAATLSPCLLCFCLLSPVSGAKSHPRPANKSDDSGCDLLVWPSSSSAVHAVHATGTKHARIKRYSHQRDSVI
jgi:hypothetical protein